MGDKLGPLIGRNGDRAKDFSSDSMIHGHGESKRAILNRSQPFKSLALSADVQNAPLV